MQEYNCVFMVDTLNEVGKIFKCNVISSTYVDIVVSHPIYQKLVLHPPIDMTFRGYAYFFGFKEAKECSKEAIKERLKALKEKEKNIAEERAVLIERRSHYSLLKL